MKKNVLFIVTLVFMFSSFNTCWAEPNIAAPSAILIDAKSGKVLFEKNADTIRPPASTTKIMTAILAIEHGKLDEVVTISANPSKLIEKGSSQVSLLAGEELTFEQLLYALMLSSANDAAIAIAEHLTGLQGNEAMANFSDMMNKRAKDLGATNTSFQNPNGLDRFFDNHVTTAKDLAIIARHGMTLPKFREVVSTVTHPIPATNKQPERNYITNSNKMIWKINKARQYEFCIGIKTGYTLKAKHCFVSSAKKGDMEIISVVLGIDGTNGSNIYDDTKALFEYGFNNFEHMKLLEKGQIIDTVKLEDLDKSVNLLANEELEFLAGETDKAGIQSKIVKNQSIKTPLKKGDILGNITYSVGNIQIGKVNLISAEDVEKPKTSLIKRFLLLFIILVAIFLIWMIFIALLRLYRRKNGRYKSIFQNKEMFNFKRKP